MDDLLMYKSDNSIYLKKNDIELSVFNLEEGDIFFDKLDATDLSKMEKDYVTERYQELVKNKKDRELDGIEDTEDEDEKIIQPYDPDKVKYSLKLFSVLTLYYYMSGYDGEEEPTIELRPEFQRNFVWKNKNKSLLIESILLNIPIPSIYLNQSASEKYFPADGLQRLNTLNEFMSGELRLTGLEYLSDYNGYRYKGQKNSDKVLPLNIKRKIRDYQITCFVIEKETPDKVKLDIFKRLNSTGMKLSQQELRNSITTNSIRNLYKEIEGNKYFSLLVTRAVNANRFVHHEFILRFIGSYLWQVEKELDYRGNMNPFLDEVLVFIKDETNSQFVSEAKHNLLATLEIAYNLFGEDAFRKPYTKRKGQLNTLLFTQILICINQLNITVEKSKRVGNVKKEFDIFLNNNQKLLLSVSSATNNIKNISYANDAIKDFFKSI